jgi:hypothetical protein
LRGQEAVALEVKAAGEAHTADELERALREVPGVSAVERRSAKERRAGL